MVHPIRLVVTLLIGLITLPLSVSHGQATESKNAAETKNVLFLAGRPSHGYGAHEHYAGCQLLAKSLESSVENLKTEVIRTDWPSDEVLATADVVVMYSDGGGGQAPALACLTSILHGPQLQPPLPVPLLPGVLNSFPMTVYPAAPQLVIPSVWPGPMFVGQGALDAVSGHPAMLSTQISPVPHSSVLDDAAVSGLKLLASSQDPARACHPAKRNDRGSESDTSDSHGERAGGAPRGGARAAGRAL